MIIFSYLSRVFRNLFMLFTSKFRYKLFFIYVVVITIPILFFGLLSFVLSSKVIENNFIKYKDRLNDQILLNIEENIHNLTRQTMAIYTSLNDIMYILNTPIDSIDEKYPDTYARVYNYLQTIIQGNDRIGGISLISTDGTIRFYGSKNYGQENIYNVSDEPWFIKTLASKGPPVVFEPHYNPFSYDKKNLVISIGRPVINLESYKVTGMILVDQDMNRFSELFSNIELEHSEIITVLGKSGDIIFTNGTLKLGDYKAIFSAGNGKLSSFKYSLNGSEMLISQKTSEEFGWKVVSVIPVSELQTKSLFLRNINISLLIVLIIFTFAISIFTSYLITIPLKKLAHSFKKLQKGDFSTSVSIKGNDELAEIGTTFNDMVSNIKNLIAQKYEMGILRKQAELDSLQSQINPHFLFNTLNSIKAVSDKGFSEKTSIMVQNLSDIFRYSLNRGKYIVKFSDELEHIKKYLYIQECRFAGKYDVFYDVDDDVMNNDILRLTLQPIVENALYHGLEPKLEKGEIRIAAKNINEEFIIYISNNGIAIPEDELVQINGMLEQNPEMLQSQKPDRLGIYNVNARIKFHFGSGYGLRIYSKPGSNTTVKITLPLADKEINK